MRYHVVRIVVAAGLLAGMLLSLRLWLTDRTYPHVPVWDGLPPVPTPWDRVVFGAILSLLALTIILPRRWPLLAAVGLTAAWSLWDQTRWQPWVYQYTFLLAALGLGGASPERRTAALNACRLIVAATYFWSGLQKYNVVFVTEVHTWVFDPVLKVLPDPLAGWAAAQGWSAAAAEAVLGLGLLFRPTRVVAVPLVVLMHATLLFCLGPWGHDWNSVVWPWNAALAVLVVVLFARTPDVKPWHVLWPRRLPFARAALLLFGVMPAFNFWGLWDSYLSAALYSGNTPNARIVLDDEAAERLPPGVREKHVWGGELDLFGWAIDELNVPPYSAPRVYRGIARRLAAPGDPPCGVVLEVSGRPDWRTGERATTTVDLGP
jgi:hypothetical protein